MTAGHRGRVAAGVGGLAVVGLVLEALARRVEGGLRDPLPMTSEAAIKLERLRALDQQRRSPRILFIGASVLDADIDPQVVDQELGWPEATFNACLTGSDLAAMRHWWRLIQPMVTPDLVVVEAHPGMMLPPGTMADKLQGRLDELTDCLAHERGPARPALVGAAAAGWPRVREALHRSFGPSPGTGSVSTPGAPEPRNRANGHLQVFQDVPFEVGAGQLGEENWYDLMQIDLSAAWRHDEYLAFVEEVRARVPAVLVAVSPLLLEAAPATAPGAEVPSAISDATVDRASARGLEVVDLRRCVQGRADFADPFHLRAHAVERASRTVAAAAGPLLRAP